MPCRSHFSITQFPLWKEHLSLVAVCDLQTAGQCSLPVAFCPSGSRKCQVCAPRRSRVPVPAGVGHRLLTEGCRTNKWAPVSESHFLFSYTPPKALPVPRPGREFVTLPKGWQGQTLLLPEQPKGKAAISIASPGEGSGGAGSSWVR